ncbi:MAG: hypothetical protein H6Q89_4915 [Myxococcaceae bacterium]|nr:hypothetical protein [Myxococcaceae bacterium]
MSQPTRKQVARARGGPVPPPKARAPVLDPRADPDDRPFAMIKLRSREWHRAWKELARLSGDRDCMAECPISGEVWQYMGSTILLGHWEHSFRHRNHPASNTRRLVWIPASPGWVPDEQRPAHRTLH